MTFHPLDPLGRDEVEAITSALKKAYPNQRVSFRVVSLVEPAKAAFRLYEANNTLPPRMAMALFSVDGVHPLHEAFVDVKTGKVMADHTMGTDIHSLSAPTDMMAAETACLSDAGVKREIARLQLPDGAEPCIDAWTYATDEHLDVHGKTVMCWMYCKMADDDEANHYAYPLDFVVELDGITNTVIKIVRIPTSASLEEEPVDADGTGPVFDRSVISTANEYAPSLQTKPCRNDIKPYIVSQPEGPSFTVEGQVIRWQKWEMHVGFNYREGMVISAIKYDSRNVFSRLSLSEMQVPYADGRAPYNRKAAFDLGSNGAGVCANNLALGCDCLGHIKYFGFYNTTNDGTPKFQPNTICCHEIDDGIMWKHTNYRNGKASVTRSRVLVLQSIITVSNYEYIFAFHFNTAAEIHYEVRATGIMSTTPVVGNEHNASIGTLVAPGVFAPYHQHMFCLRIDPALDGDKNSVVIEESVATPRGKGNLFGVGYHSTQQKIERESFSDMDPQKNRTVKIVNPNVLNPVNGKPVGYKIKGAPSQLLLADPESFHAKRGEFGEHAFWYTKYRDEEFWASGKWTNQSVGGTGLKSLIAGRQESIDNEDLVVWHTFGSTHNPTIEQWPVMPAEVFRVGLIPSNFFTQNPALDLPQSTQKANQSTLVEGATIQDVHAQSESRSTCCKA